MKEYHPPLGGRDGLRLDFNENTLACSPRVMEVLAKYYGGRSDEVSGARVGGGSRWPHHLGVKPEQVLLTNGVDEAIHVLCQAFLDRGDEMLLPVPTYSMYEVYGSAARRRRSMRCRPRDGLSLSARAMLAAIHSAHEAHCDCESEQSRRAATVARDAILAIAERAPQAVVLVDEAYFHFFGETVIDLIGKMPNLIVARTFSKAYGLAGLRLGALVAAEETMHWLRRVISPYSVNRLRWHACRRRWRIKHISTGMWRR